jgi:hypothetical protein
MRIHSAAQAGSIEKKNLQLPSKHSQWQWRFTARRLGINEAMWGDDTGKTAW